MKAYKRNRQKRQASLLEYAVPETNPEFNTDLEKTSGEKQDEETAPIDLIEEEDEFKPDYLNENENH